jgi:predicted HTH transcriptional regulator
MSELRDAGFGMEQDGSAGVEEESFLTEQEERRPETARGLRPSDIRRANRELILALLARDGPTSRVALALRTGLSRVTVGAIVADLLRDGCVREEGSAPSTPAGGRRAILVRLNERVSCIAEDSPHRATP